MSESISFEELSIVQMSPHKVLTVVATAAYVLHDNVGANIAHMGKVLKKFGGQLAVPHVVPDVGV
jgi:hypothetical protein